MALLPDQKFSTFDNGGDLVVGDIIVGLRDGINARFNYTGELPAGVIVPVLQGGTGATTATGARTNLGLGTVSTQNSNTVNITGGTLDGVIITSSTAALLSGSVVAAPSAGTDITNKTYVDSMVGGSVASVSGTLNRITSTGGTTPVIDISASYVGQSSITTLGTIGTGAWQGTLIGATYGGTGVNNGASTLTMAASHTLSGAFASTFTFTGVTGVTFPTSGTLATTTQLPTPAALTKVDDTNVTLTLGGTPATALLQATSLTLGWTGQLSVARGGTAVSSVTTAPTGTAFAGWDANSNMSASAFIEGFATQATASGTTTLTVSSKQIQEFTGTLNQIVSLPVASTLVAGMYFDIINNSSGVLTINSSGGNLVLSMAANTSATIVCVLNSGTSAASWNASYFFDNGAGVLSITGTANQVIASASTGAVTLSLPQSIATASSPTFASLVLTNPHIAGAGGLVSFQVFTSGTGATYTKPAGVTSILVEVVGGGGGGGGSLGAGTGASGGGGGGSGGYARLYVPSSAASYTYTVGAAGTAGTAGTNNGGSGGTTTFSASSLQATGGGGGVGGGNAGVTAALFFTGGVAGVGSNGTFNSSGQPGGYATIALGQARSGNGGSSIYGGGAICPSGATAGNAGSNYGSGGSGGISTTVSSAGGLGSAGVIVVWEFC